jgi:alpha-L-fucosidase 2
MTLLPSLPKEWPDGSIKGLCARGGFDVAMTWKDGKLTSVEILSKQGNPCYVRYGEKQCKFPTAKGERYRLDAALKNHSAFRVPE